MPAIASQYRQWHFGGLRPSPIHPAATENHQISKFGQIDGLGTGREEGNAEWLQEKINGAVIGGINDLILTSQKQFATDWILLTAKHLCRGMRHGGVIGSLILHRQKSTCRHVENSATLFIHKNETPRHLTFIFLPPPFIFSSLCFKICRRWAEV